MKVSSKREQLQNIKTCLDIRPDETFYVEFELDRYRGLYFTSAVGEYHPLYIDEHLARALDMPSSPLPVSYVSALVISYLVEWSGNPECISELNIDVKKPLFPGDVIVIEGHVVERKKARVKVVFSIKRKGEKITSNSWAILRFNEQVQE